jgi:hypothetical protein
MTDKKVKIVKFRTAFGVLLPKILKGAVVSSHCYHNTLRLINHYYAAGIEYVEGLLVSKLDGKSVTHVWQKHEGRYFDITIENSRHFEPKHYDYYPLIEGTVEDLKASGYVFGDYWIPLTEQTPKSLKSIDEAS